MSARTATTTGICSTSVTNITVTEANKKIIADTVNVETTVAIEQYFISAIAAGVLTTAHNDMTQENVQSAIEQLDAAFGRGPVDPTTETEPFLDEGDLFYNTNTNQLKVYRGSGTWDILLQAEGDMDTLDGSTF
jgi:hypothetical protein